MDILDYDIGDGMWIPEYTHHFDYAIAVSGGGGVNFLANELSSNADNAYDNQVNEYVSSCYFDEVDTLLANKKIFDYETAELKTILQETINKSTNDETICISHFPPYILLNKTNATVENLIVISTDYDYDFWFTRLLARMKHSLGNANNPTSIIRIMDSVIDLTQSQNNPEYFSPNLPERVLDMINDNFDLLSQHDYPPCFIYEYIIYCHDVNIDAMDKSSFVSFCNSITNHDIKNKYFNNKVIFNEVANNLQRDGKVKNVIHIGYSDLFFDGNTQGLPISSDRIVEYSTKNIRLTEQFLNCTTNTHYQSLLNDYKLRLSNLK